MQRLFFIICIVFSFSSFAQVVINEFSAHKGIVDENEQESDWIELYNNSNQPINLSSYFLTDDLEDLEKWQLPEVLLLPNEFITFYSSGKNTAYNDGMNDFYHTNFKLSPSEYIALFDGNQIVDSTLVDADLYFGLSMGKYPDGGNQWFYFDDVSPNESNNQSMYYQGITEEATVNLESGWYLGTQNISISAQANTYVFYTTDGSIPTAQSTLYSEPLTINANTCLSFRSFCYDQLPSKLNDRTYIFEEDNHNLAVFSIHTHPNNLWSQDSGIYVSGPNPEADYPYYGSNFWQPWSRYSRLEYFDANKNKKAEESLDLEIHGGWSRAEPQKSFRLDFKSKYTGRLEEAVLDDKNHIESFNNLNLRNGGQHTWTDKIQDALMSRLARETKVNHMAYQPCIVYLNGEYWGVYGIREKIDEHYIEDNYGFDSDSIDLMNSFNVLAGSDQSFMNSYQNLMDEDATSAGYYQLFTSIWNVENYMDYFIIQTFIQNMDWMGIAWGANNIKLWRPQNENGKFNYVLYDTDGSLGYFGQNYWENYLAYAMNPSYTNYHSQIFNKIIQNETFRCQFASRYADLLNTALSYENAQEKAEVITSDMSNAMPRHIERWLNSGNANGTISSMSAWSNSVSNVLNYYGERIYPAQYFLDYELNLQGMNSINLDVFPTNSGTIDLNTISLETFPWNGIYFNDCGLNLTAIPDSGYSFTHWSDSDENIISEDVNLLISITDYQEFKANFVKCDDVLSVSIFADDNTISSDVLSSDEQISYLWYLNGIPYSSDSILIQPVSGNYVLEVSSNGCSLLSDEINFNAIIVGLDELRNLKAYVYPNPFKKQALLDLSDYKEQVQFIHIYDSHGRKIITIHETSQKKIKISKNDLTSGVYFLELVSQNYTKRVKFVIN